MFLLFYHHKTSQLHVDINTQHDESQNVNKFQATAEQAARHETETTEKHRK